MNGFTFHIPTKIYFGDDGEVGNPLFGMSVRTEY